MHWSRSVPSHHDVHPLPAIVVAVEGADGVVVDGDGEAGVVGVVVEVAGGVVVEGVLGVGVGVGVVGCGSAGWSK